MSNQVPEQSERDKSSLVIPWLKDQSRTDLDNLPNPDILASEINEKLKSYIESFKYTKKTINGSLALWLCFIQRRKKQNPLMTFRQYRSKIFFDWISTNPDSSFESFYKSFINRDIPDFYFLRINIFIHL